MKKLFSILVLGLVVSVLGIGTAHATPSIDGYWTPSSEWDAYYFNGADPDESGIPQSYDIKLLRVWWDDTYAYVMTQLYGTPSFAQIDGTISDPVFYQWNVDCTGDDVADFYLKLTGDDMGSGGVGTLRLFDMSHTQFATGNAHVHDIVEARFDHTGSAFDPYDEPDAMYMLLENQGGPADDRLPNDGWTYRVPEPSSMLLLGIGLLGLGGRAIRRKKRFTA